MRLIPLFCHLVADATSFLVIVRFSTFFSSLLSNFSKSGDTRKPEPVHYLPHLGANVSKSHATDDQNSIEIA